MSRRAALQTLRIMGYAVVCAFLGWQVWRVRHGLTGSLTSIGWPALTVATALAAVGWLPGFLGWRTLLVGLGARLTLVEAGKVYFLAGLTRYLPGGVWPVLAHAALARTLREPPARLAAAFLASQLVGVIAGLAVGLLALPRLIAAHPLWWLLVPVLVVSSLPLIFPRLLGPMVRAGQRLLRRPAAEITLPGRATTLRATGLMLVGWLITGAHVATLAIALGAPPLPAVTIGVGGYAVSVLIGGLAVLLPRGIGAREVVLGLTLAGLLGGPALIAVVALSRVLLTVVDAVTTAAVLGALAWTGRLRHPTPAAGPEPASPIPATPTQAIPMQATPMQANPAPVAPVVAAKGARS